MDISTLALIAGIGSSLFTQMVKRQKAGTLENILLAGGMAFGGTALSSQLGFSIDVAQTVITSFAFHGLASDQEPLKALRFGAIDKIMGGLSKGFSSIDSSNR